MGNASPKHILTFIIFILLVMAEETQTSGTDLEEINTEDELSTDIGQWSDKERKKLQHMTVFHQEYQRVFGDRVSLCTIIRKQMTHMNPPIPSSICKEEIQDTESNEVIVEFITDSKGNKVKRLKPLFIKSEPNKTYVHHVPSDDELPSVPEEKFNQKREITIDSYSESISLDDEASDDRTVTAESDSSEAQEFEDTPYETKATDIEATLNQIASGLQSAADGYLALASHLPNLSSYELPQTIAQILPPPINVPMPVRKDLAMDGDIKTIHYLLRGDYELNNMSWNQLQQKYKVSCDTVYTALKGRRRPGGLQYCQKKKLKPEVVASTSGQIN